MLARLGALAVEPAPGTDADRIDRIAAFEQLRGALAAAQQAEMVAFARSQVEQHIADDRFDPAAVGRGIGDQIGLACRVSPFHGSRRLGIARALHFDLPGVRDLLAAGRISEEIAATVVSETRHLDAERRRLVDEQICAAEIDRLSPRRAAAVVGRLAYEADRAAYVARGRTAPEGPPGRSAACSGHDERAQRLPAGRARRGVPGRAAQAHRRRRRRGRHPHARPDHGRHPRRTRHRTSPRCRRQRRGRHRAARSMR